MRAVMRDDGECHVAAQSSWSSAGQVVHCRTVFMSSATPEPECGNRSS